MQRTCVAKHCRSDNVLASAVRIGESVGLAVWEAVSGHEGTPGMFHDRNKVGGGSVACSSGSHASFYERTVVRILMITQVTCEDFDL